MGKEHSMECDPKILAEFREGKVSPKWDVKVLFTDLPPEIQQTIHRMGVVDGGIDMTGYEAWKRDNGQA